MKKSSSLLIDESPLQVLPTLAAKIGLNEAIMLQQIKYWMNISGKSRDGRIWIYNTAKQWHEQFPFWSVRTIERIIASLRDKGMILTANYNAAKFDKTLWYTIDFDAIPDTSNPTKCQRDSDKMAVSYSDNLTEPIPENTETTTENTNTLPPSSGEPIPKKSNVDNRNEVEKAWCDLYLEHTGEEYVRANIPAERATLKKYRQAGITDVAIIERMRAYFDEARFPAQFNSRSMLVFFNKWNAIGAALKVPTKKQSIDPDSFEAYFAMTKKRYPEYKWDAESIERLKREWERACLEQAKALRKK